MGTLTLNPLQSLLAAIACLLLGAAVNRKVGFLSKYNIPDPVTGACCSPQSRPSPRCSTRDRSRSTRPSSRRCC